LQFPSDTFYEDASRVIYAPSQLEVGTYYTASIESETYYGYDAISYADVWYKKAYSKTGYNLDNRIIKLAEKLTKNSENSFEKSEAIIKYFKINYLYKHSSIKSPIQDQSLSDMLFKTKIGNAMQFNTALIMMLRSSGEYARLATGYAPGEYNQITNSYIIKREYKAVWTEVFVKERGWVSIHAADDIPFEGELLDEEALQTIHLTQTQVLYISLCLFIISFPIFYYSRKYIWKYLATYKIKTYKEKDDINFVVLTYKEIEKFYKKFHKGQKRSCTIQEYEQYLKTLKPESIYLIEYISFYSNQAIYNKKLDLDFHKERYLEIALYLVEESFEIESLKSFIARKILKKDGADTRI
ncbi:MAG: transglutaminase-like domain-containing protein, partial [Sulfurimonas sp.]